MASSPPPRARANERPRDGADFWRRLLYRWFVEYNPLYLLSAALVLGGCFLLSRGLASDESPFVSLGITLVSEVYAFGLLGGAALLTRIGPRRPAVMLALLFALYQWDLTLHTETCAYLGATGRWAAAVWLAVFHLLAQEHLLPPPWTAAQWGATFVGLGFLLLAGSLATSYRLRAIPPERGR